MKWFKRDIIKTGPFKGLETARWPETLFWCFVGTGGWIIYSYFFIGW